MLIEKSSVSTARIEVQQHFCDTCSIFIKRELQEIEEVKNIRLYPKDSLIIFNFANAYKLSVALNTLSEIGYCEKGEFVNNQRFKNGYCGCKREF